MKTSDKGRDFIKSFEGLRLKAYYATVHEKEKGIATVGWGSTRYEDGSPVKIQDVLGDEDGADHLFSYTLKAYEDAVSSAVKVPLTQNQFDACVSLCYNIGVSAFKGSTLVKRLNAGLYKEAADQFPRWNKQNGKPLNGLTRRRAAEREMFLDNRVDS